MLKGDWFASVVRYAVRRPAVVLGIVGALVLGGAVLAATQLKPSSSTDSLVGKGSDAYERHRAASRSEFGDEAVVVLAQGELPEARPDRRTSSSSSRSRAASAATCPRRAARTILAKLPKPCQELAKLKPARAVYGPGTFINTAIGGAEDFLAGKTAQVKQAGDAARAASKARGDSAAQAGEARQGGRGARRAGGPGRAAAPVPALQHRQPAVARVHRGAGVRRHRRAPDQPKQRFAYLFPSNRAAMITVRLRPDLTDSRALARDRADPAGGARPSASSSRTARGPCPACRSWSRAWPNSVQDSIFILLGVALLVMAVALSLVFRTRMRLLPLGLALGSAAIVYGGLALFGGSLTMASIAVLPVLIGLAVDYSIQFQARFDEQLARGREPMLAATAAARAGGPSIATASLATAAGMLMLLLSPVPMVSDFGADAGGRRRACRLRGCADGRVRAAGALRAVAARARPSVPPLVPRARARGARACEVGALERARGAAARRGGSSGARGALVRVLAATSRARVLGVASAIAVIGLVASMFHEVTSDVRELVPQDLPALKDANTLQEATGVSGEIDITVTRARPDRPRGARLDDALPGEGAEATTATRRAATRSCRQKVDPPELCPALSLPDLFRSGVPQPAGRARAARGGAATTSRRRSSRASRSREPRVANLAFGIRLMPLDRQQQVVDDIRAAIDDPALKRPKGVDARGGRPARARRRGEREARVAVVAARARCSGRCCSCSACSGCWRGRRVRAAALPLIPVALASGWSGAMLFALQIPLNPMSVTLGALVVAIATEFSVLHQRALRGGARARRRPAVVALERDVRSTGAAVIASGVTAIAGFAVLIASDISMLRQFGISTVVDLTVGARRRPARAAGGADLRRGARAAEAQRLRPAAGALRRIRRAVAAAAEACAAPDAAAVPRLPCAAVASVPARFSLRRRRPA